MSRLLVIKEVLLAYVKAELLREHGIVFSIMALSLWLLLFLAPLALFAPSKANNVLISTQAFISVLIFTLYSMASWDWGWGIRWLIYQGIFEYVLISGRDILILYVGIVPVSITWLVFVAMTSYGILTLFMGPPKLVVHDWLALLTGIASLMTVLLAYALILGGTTIGVGTSGPIVEFLSWILPIATGGLTPLASLPGPVRTFALLTPFSYPADLLRYGLGLTTPVMGLKLEILIGVAYAIAFLLVGTTYFRMELRKVLREGVKSIALH